MTDTQTHRHTNIWTSRAKNIHCSRFAPGKDWEVNIGLQEALTLLEPIKETYHWASTSDLIVLTSTLALSQSLGGVPELENSFCPGRVDDDSGEGWRFLEPRVAGRRGESVHLIKAMIILRILEKKVTQKVVQNFTAWPCLGC